MKFNAFFDKILIICLNMRFIDESRYFYDELPRYDECSFIFFFIYFYENDYDEFMRDASRSWGIFSDSCRVMMHEKICHFHMRWNMMNSMKIMMSCHVSTHVTRRPKMYLFCILTFKCSFDMKYLSILNINISQLQCIKQYL